MGVFGFAGSVTALAGPPNCDFCLPGYYYCNEYTPDVEPSCLQTLFDCQTANGCAISEPPAG